MCNRRVGLTRTVGARLVLAVTSAATIAACASEPAAVTADDYVAGLETICEETTAVLDELPTPPEEISVTDFAAGASSAISNEASRLRRLDPPDDLDDDHRALIRNADEQASAWQRVAELDVTDPADATTLTETTTLITSLQLGRNDLVDEMGAPACRRGAA
jgi:hypothetical protein